MTSKPVITIPREKAVFRLDQNGRWRHGEEKFTNQKIIQYFHSRIRKDEDGFFLHQEHSQYIEKVYFPYEDTPLFVFRITDDTPPLLFLNTGERLPLEPEKLFVKGDILYTLRDGDFVRFSQDCMLAISRRLDLVDGDYVIEMDGKKRVIPRAEEES
ncbi:MAG: MFS transporter permease [Desulfobacterales bacterium]